MGRSVSPDPRWERLLSEQFGQNGRLFFGLAHGLLRDAHAAEDVCQQALLKGWEKRYEIRDPLKLRAWLAEVVVKECLRLRRRAKLELRTARAVAAPGLQGGEPRREPVEMQDSVANALERLPETTRIIVILRVMEGLPGNDVARLLKCSAATVSRLLYEGMELLRKLLVDWRESTGGPP